MDQMWNQLNAIWGNFFDIQQQTFCVLSDLEKHIKSHWDNGDKWQIV